MFYSLSKLQAWTHVCHLETGALLLLSREGGGWFGFPLGGRPSLHCVWRFFVDGGEKDEDHQPETKSPSSV